MAISVPSVRRSTRRTQQQCRKPSRGSKNCSCREAHILRRELDVLTSSSFCSFKVMRMTCDCFSFRIGTSNRQLVELITFSDILFILIDADDRLIGRRKEFMFYIIIQLLYKKKFRNFIRIFLLKKNIYFRK